MLMLIVSLNYNSLRTRSGQKRKIIAKKRRSINAAVLFSQDIVVLGALRQLNKRQVFVRIPTFNYLFVKEVNIAHPLALPPHATTPFA